MRISDWSSDVCSSDLEYRKLWWTLIAVLVVTFSILGFYGAEFYKKPPPIPAQVVSASGTVLMTRDDILDGQRSEEHTSELQSLMRISYAVFCLKKKNKQNKTISMIDTRISN